jgi:putative flippase GtrA
MGLALLYILVHLLHVGASLAFLLQSIVSVEVSFLLNWNLTWKQRETPFKTAAKRFHAMRIATIPVNQLIFLGLRDLGVEYLLAMVVTVGFFTAINYAVCHIWTFPDVIVSEPAEVMAEEI